MRVRLLPLHPLWFIKITFLLVGMAALDSKASGKMGIRAVVYYMTTTVIAVFIGIIIVVIVHPGKGSKEKMHREGKIEPVTAADAFLDLIRCVNIYKYT